MTRYRIVKYVENKNYGAYFFTVEKKVLWWWINIFETEHCLGRFANFEDAHDAWLKLVNPKYKIIHTKI